MIDIDCNLKYKSSFFILVLQNKYKTRNMKFRIFRIQKAHSIISILWAFKNFLIISVSYLSQ